MLAPEAARVLDASGIGADGQHAAPMRMPRTPLPLAALVVTGCVLAIARGA